VDEARQPGEDRRSDALSGREDDPSAGSGPAPEPLPPSLRQRLDRCADEWLRQCAAQSGAARRPSRTSSTLPWLVAAAGVLLAIVGWWPRLAEVAPATVAGDFDHWRAQRARERMLATSGVEHVAWGGASEKGAGDVVWDPRRQQGYLRLRGFVANDPSRSRYQLWIFDAARDDRYPVDGGVFDVPAGRDEVVIPMHPALPVSRAVAFAITVERPGGAVVSAREKLVAFAGAGT
jgi:hypothetical protein